MIKMNRTARNRAGVSRTGVNRNLGNQTVGNQTVKRTFERTVGLACVAGLLLGACTTATDSEDGLADNETPTIGSAPVDADVDVDVDVADGGTSQDAGAEIGSEPVGAQSASIDDAEPDLAMAVDREISESAAEEPTVESNPEIDDDGPIEVPQADLDAGESVLCASIQIGLDAARDGVDDVVSEQKSRLLAGIESINDSELSSLLGTIDDGALSEVLLAGALERCEKLGYES